MLNTFCYYEVDPFPYASFIDDTKPIYEATYKTHTITGIKIVRWVNYVESTQVYSLRWNHNGNTCGARVNVSIFDHNPDKKDIIDAILNEVRREYSYPEQAISYFEKWLFSLAEVLPKGASQKQNSNTISEVARQLPGMMEKVFSPCTCRGWDGSRKSIYNIVQHLNDEHTWSREKIADWLDKLMDVDGIDLTFKVEV